MIQGNQRATTTTLHTLAKWWLSKAVLKLQNFNIRKKHSGYTTVVTCAISNKIS